jgi:ribosome biogenesis GTPase / thiamine phosphate phosphatase
MAELKQGRVVRTDAKVCQVDVDGTTLRAAPRGLLFGEDGERLEQKNPVAVGDLVELDAGTEPASLVRVLPRRNYLGRLASRHDPREQVLVANVDQLFVIASLARPGFSSNRTDRILAGCVWHEVPAVLVLNKIDLVEPDEVAGIRGTYEAVPVPVIETCALDGRGVEDLRERMRDRVSVFYGASGAGKSTLLNALEPGLKLKVGKVSKYWDAGRHTTTVSELHRLGFGGWAIDTPGIRVFRLYDVKPAEVRDLFPEFERFQRRCRFPDCSHDHEPECAVFDAVESGELAASRYASYVELLDEIRQAAPVGEDDEDGGGAEG